MSAQRGTISLSSDSGASGADKQQDLKQRDRRVQRDISGYLLLACIAARVPLFRNTQCPELEFQQREQRVQ